jgi:(p)ppGpp synthase/HD superfamily hydrolase
MEEAKRRIDSDLRLRREFLYHWQTRLERMLVEMGVEGRVEWQVMGYWEAVKKRESMRARDFSQVQLVSFRVVLPSELDCRMASQFIRVSEDGLVDPQRADDYITEKTYNGYRAMHEGLRLKEGSTEVAFVTEEMEEFNAWGVVRGLRRGEDVSRYSLKLFFDTEGRVIKFLPEEATGVDLVVSIDPQLLHSVGSILVDDREFPLSINIPNAAVVRLVMKEGNGVDVGLFEYAMLPKTREKLEEMAREIGVEADREHGRRMLVPWMKTRGFDDLNDLVWGESERKKMRLVLMELGVRDIEELYLEMGLGNRAVEEVVRVFERSELEGVRSGLMKIRLAGRDERGIMAEVSGLISEFGGVIRLGKTEGDGQLYTFELVVAGVGSEAKLEIERRLSDDGHRYSDVTVV